MREDEYKRLTNERDILVGLTKGPLPKHYKQHVNNKLNELRGRIKEAHKEQYKTTFAK